MNEQVKGEAPPSGRVWQPVVAGLFYPKDPSDLCRTLDELLANRPK